MVKTMRNSSLYIALSGRASELEKAKPKLEHTFSSLFEDSAKRVSEIKEEINGEFIYEIKTPIMNDENVTKEFFENLEVLLYELIDFNPHFTQFRRVDA